MTKIDIFSGFLGAGKTTLIKKLIGEAYKGEKLVLIENEFGEIGIDGGFMQEAGIEVNEMNSGCICCSLVGDFGKALGDVLDKFAPDRILIEPSGVGKLSDVIKAVKNAGADKAQLNCYTAVVDAGKCKMYMKNFGEFFGDQIKHASSVILSHTEKTTEDKLQKSIELIKELNKNAIIISTPWDKISGSEILSAMERENTLSTEMESLKHEHHHHHGEECHCHEGEHHHHHGEECHCHEGEHHHHHGEECHCHEGEHHHHHADEVFTSWGTETARKYSKEQIDAALHALSDFEKYGTVLRAKGIVDSEDGEWIHFDYVPDGIDIRTGPAAVTGRICVIGAQINEDSIEKLFK